MRTFALTFLFLMLVGALSPMAQEVAPVCETELAFYKRYSNVVAVERDRYLQRITQMDMQLAYLKQQVEQLRKAKTDKEQP